MRYLSYLELAYSKINFNVAIATIFCDFTKVFDCVNCTVFLQKLRVYEIKEEALS